MEQGLLKTFQKDKLTMRAYVNRTEMGKAAAADIAACMEKLLAEKETINMVKATSQAKFADKMLTLLTEEELVQQEESLQEMVEAAKEKGIVFAVGHVERFNPAMDYLETHLDKPRFIEARRLAAYPPARPI